MEGLSTKLRDTIVLTVDLKSGRNTVTVPALPGCVTDGATIEQGRERTHEAISLYLEGEDESTLAEAINRPEVVVASIDIAIPA